MRKLLVMVAMAVVCLFGASQSTIISHAKSTWQVETPKEETQGGVTYYTYPNADGQTCWLYEIKAGENADIKTLTIPETIGGLTVTRLGTDIEDKNLFGEYAEWYHGGDGSNAFTKRVKQIQFPETITEIDKNCFCGFDSMTSVKLPSRVTKISDHLFYDCDSLQSIILPEAMEELDVSAFSQCDKLNNIVIPEQNVKYISSKKSVMSKDGKTLYFVYSNDKTYKIPASVTLVKKYAFYYGCRAKKVEISKNVKELEQRALQSYKIKNVTVSRKNPHFKKDGQSIYRTSDRSLAVAIAPKGRKYVMSDKVRKLTINVSVIGSIDPEEMHAGLILREVILSKKLKYIEKNCVFGNDLSGYPFVTVDIIQFQTAKPPKCKDKHALPLSAKIRVPKKSAKAYKKVYKKYKRWKHVKDNWSEY